MFINEMCNHGKVSENQMKIIISIRIYVNEYYYLVQIQRSTNGRHCMIAYLKSM